MKHILLAATLMAFLSASAQIRSSEVKIHNAFTEIPQMKHETNPSLLSTWIKGDPQRTYRFSMPMQIHRNSPGLRATDAYWAGYMTTQSMQRGKIGTYYLWDLQGNLRESRMFFDVNRKSKYSFKIVVPRY